MSPGADQWDRRGLENTPQAEGKEETATRVSEPPDPQPHRSLTPGWSPTVTVKIPSDSVSELCHLETSGWYTPSAPLVPLPSPGLCL